MFYVYQYRNSITLQPFYVGKGSGPRQFVHYEEAKRRLIGAGRKGRPSLCVVEIVEMLKQNNTPLIELLFETEDEKEAYDFEERVVDTLGRRGLDFEGILTNRSRGGRGGRRFKMPEDVRQRLIARNRQPHSETRKANNSRAQREKEVSAKVMTFKSPTGEIFQVKEWQGFLEERGLSYNLVRHAGKTITKGPNAGWELLEKQRFYAGAR